MWTTQPILLFVPRILSSMSMSLRQLVLLCAALLCATSAAAQSTKAVDAEILRVPVNFGDGSPPQTLSVAVGDVRKAPVEVAAIFLRQHGYGDKPEFPELVSGLAQIVVARANTVIAAFGTAAQTEKEAKIIARIPITLGSGEQVEMVHREGKNAVDTVVEFCGATKIEDEATAQKLLAALQQELKRIDVPEAPESPPIVLPVDFGDGKVAQFVFNPTTHRDVQSAAAQFLQQNGIQPGSGDYGSYISILVQTVAERLAALTKAKVAATTEARRPTDEVVLDLVVDNVSQRLSIPNSLDAMSAARDFAQQIGLAGKDNFDQVVSVVADQIERQRQARSTPAATPPTPGAAPLFSLPVSMDNRQYGTLRYFPWQRPRDAARRFVRDSNELENSPDALKLVSQLQNAIQRKLQALGSKAPALPVPLVTFPVNMGTGDVMFEYMTGRDPYESTVDFLEEQGQGGNAKIDEMIATLERAVIDSVVGAAKRYSETGSKLFEVPFNVGKVEAPISIYYQQPPVLAANAFCLEHATAVYGSKSSIALCTDTVVEIVLRILDQVEAKGLLKQ